METSEQMSKRLDAIEASGREPTKEEHRSLLEALEREGLVVISGDTVRVTDKGRRQGWGEQ